MEPKNLNVLGIASVLVLRNAEKGYKTFRITLVRDVAEKLGITERDKVVFLLGDDGEIRIRRAKLN